MKLASITPTQRDQANRLLAQVKTDTEPSMWGAVVQAGVRHQTDANVAPEVLGPDEPFPVETAQPDWNSFAQGTLAINLPVGQSFVDMAATAYYADQFDIDRLDLGFAEFNMGPRLVLGDGKFSFKPYGIVQGIMLGSDPYQYARGGGALARFTLGDGWWFEPQFEYKKRTFYNSDDYPGQSTRAANSSPMPLTVPATLTAFFPGARVWVSYKTRRRSTITATTNTSRV